MASMPKWTGTGKVVGYGFWIENPHGRNQRSKTYNSLNAARKAAIEHAHVPVLIYKFYDSYIRQGNKLYQKDVPLGEVLNRRNQNYSIWRVVDKEFEYGNKYVLKKDGSLGSRVTGELTVSKYGQILKYPKGRY